MELYRGLRDAFRSRVTSELNRGLGDAGGYGGGFLAWQLYVSVYVMYVCIYTHTHTLIPVSGVRRLFPRWAKSHLAVSSRVCVCVSQRSGGDWSDSRIPQHDRLRDGSSYVYNTGWRKFRNDVLVRHVLQIVRMYAWHALSYAPYVILDFLMYLSCISYLMPKSRGVSWWFLQGWSRRWRDGRDDVSLRVTRRLLISWLPETQSIGRICMYWCGFNYRGSKVWRIVG